MWVAGWLGLVWLRIPESRFPSLEKLFLRRPRERGVRGGLVFYAFFVRARNFLAECVWKLKIDVGTAALTRVIYFLPRFVAPRLGLAWDRELLELFLPALKNTKIPSPGRD